MKKTLLLFSAFGLFVSSFAQTTEWKKRPTLSVNFFLKDFKTPAAIGNSSLASVLRDKQWTNVSDMTPGLSLSYFDGLSDYVDFMATLSGSFLDYPFLSKSGRTNLGQDKFLMEADAAVNVKLLTDKYFMVPYITGGVGASMYAGSYFGAYMPVGTGLQFRLGEGNFINLQWQYRIGVSDLTNNNFHYSLGFASPLTDKKPVKLAPTPPAPVKEAPKDSDNDGITDDKDKCPTVPGVAKYDGCPVPDTDGDGINDENDKCPTEKGLAKYSGCPIPDADKDGINDEEDKCPNVPGVARYNGCPIPDTDGDGINDEEDKCPTEKGTAANSGCPELKDFNFKAENIQFETGSAKLTKAALAELDKGATILSEHSSLNILIEGYTDNSGKPAKNKELSQKRADAVKAYLMKKGITEGRLTATGYGDANPIADNKTVKGRAMNRRVEFKVKK